MRSPALALLVAAALAGGAADAQPDAGAPEGAVRTVHAEQAFDRYDLPVGRFGPETRPVLPLQGTVHWSAWRLNDPGASVAAVMQGYRTRLEEMDFEPLLDCRGEACGGFDFRFGAEILPPPGMLLDVRDFAQLSMHRAEPEAYVSVLVSRALDEIHIQTVSVAPEGDGAPVAVTDAPAAAAPAAPVTTPQDQRALLKALVENGHVPVRGLEFEPGGTRLSPGSADTLDMLARMLTRDDELSVVIVGHSDNQGALDLNIELSRQRAEAVMQALVERGVPAGRMDARGVGFLAPVASNATEEGRTANRRVELVLR